MEKAVNEKELHTKENSDEEIIDQEEINSNLDAVKEQNENQSEEETNNTKVEEKAEDIDNLKNQLEDYKNKFTRLSADFQNYKRRIEKEKSDIYKFGSEKIVVDILPVIDNFERAIKAAKDNDKETDGLLDGIEMIFSQLVDVLKKHGVEEIDAFEKEFDPNLHHAVMQEEASDRESNIVTEVFQKGYTLNSKVIRPSMVKVSK
ncbi:nucleotide exchange factor GrpE [Paramaledivibacter caminithermalis]|uniref:Protein GrpE n=1 Tax=Paramaledivibacter caminithermalis (strain DSM 15212 / CIP 107654 / DViRD3) TaxID=1121301 RepID=A0A1M6M6V3_PARC5|nr:nucleotide exchange factor GrpE [Paramaledivibacter caminithermalis]SHJ79158.1 molecular chaperone GrpE [Paramaledivibacter caminithermalis DSM 15212]